MELSVFKVSLTLNMSILYKIFSSCLSLGLGLGQTGRCLGTLGWTMSQGMSATLAGPLTRPGPCTSVKIKNGFTKQTKSRVLSRAAEWWWWICWIQGKGRLMVVMYNANHLNRQKKFVCHCYLIYCPWLNDTIIKGWLGIGSNR